MEVVLPPAACLLPTLTCLICRKIPTEGSIYLCPKGHLYCLTCCSSLKGKKCRMTGCKENLKKNLDPMLQDVYLNCQFPCIYSLCKQRVLGKDLKFHQANCHYSPIQCPDCHEVVPFQNFMKHLEKTHQVEINAAFEDDSVQNICIQFPPTESYSVSHYHNFQAENFFIHVFVKPKEVFIWVQYYGEIWRELDYSATINLKNFYGTHSTSITIPINPITASFPQVQKSQSYAHLSKELLQCYICPSPHQWNQTNHLHGTSTFNGPIDYNNDNNNYYMYPGLVTFSVTFSHNYLKAFHRHLDQDIQNFGTESCC